MTAPRCGRIMRRFEPPGWGAVLEAPPCGRRAGHRGQCRSVTALEMAARRRQGQAPSGSPVVAAVIRQAREAAGMSRRRLAASVGVTEIAVGHWEDARRTPGPESWIQLELALGPLGVVREDGPRPPAGEGQRQEGEAAA